MNANLSDNSKLRLSIATVEKRKENGDYATKEKIYPLNASNLTSKILLQPGVYYITR